MNSQRIKVINQTTGEVSYLTLDKFLLERPTIARNKSVPSPNAQNLALLNPPTDTSALMCSAIDYLSDDTNMPAVHRFAIELSFLCGLRITEILNLKGGDISANGNVYVRSLKGSKPRIVKIHYSLALCVRFAGSLGSPFLNFDRFYFYRLFNKLGLTLSLSGAGKRAVTHSGRHAYITELSTITQDIETIKTNVGHVSQKSTVGYIHNKKKGTNTSVRNTGKAIR